MMDHSVIKNSGGDFSAPSPTVIKVIGCGGGGSNAVNRMIEAKIKGVEFVALNTDLQALGKSIAEVKIPIGQKLTQGLGAGGDPAIGANAAEEDKEAITRALNGANMVFVTAGMGGGTGTGSAPVVARIAKEMGALTIGIVTTPFAREGERRMNLAREGIKKLREAVDSIIIIPNEKITKIYGNGISFMEQYRLADDQLRQSIEGVSTIITEYGYPNIDFADVTAAMKNQGTAIFGIGVASGENRAVDAATSAINNPLLEDTNIDGAQHFIIFIRAGNSFTLNESDEIAKIVCASAAENYELKSGIIPDESMGDEISVTVIATGFNQKNGYDKTVAAKKEVNPVKDPNVVDYDEFDGILTGSKKGNAPIIDEDFSDEGFFDTRSAPKADIYEEPVTQRRTGSLGDALSASEKSSLLDGINVPDEFLGNSDLEVPACWRKTQGLTTDIDLSE